MNSKAKLTTVYADVKIEGVHFFKGAPDQVYYLAYPHRHVFHFKCFKEVFHDDRDVEFIMLKNAITHFIKQKYYSDRTRICDFDYRSCEMLAKELVSEFNLVKCEVSEDGENGITVEL